MLPRRGSARRLSLGILCGILAYALSLSSATPSSAVPNSAGASSGPSSLVEPAVGSSGVGSLRPPSLDRLDHLTVADGLAHSTVWEIFQDSRGFIWIATSEGLNRFDGYHLETFQHDFKDDNSLIANSPISLAEDTSGNLWIGTTAGLDRYDHQRHQFTHYLHDPQRANSVSGNVIESLQVDTRGRLWVATSGGLDIYRPDVDGFERYTAEPGIPGALPASAFASLKLSPQGDLWVAVNDYVCRLEKTSEIAFACSSLRLEDDAATSQIVANDLAIDLEGRVWVTTFETGVRRYDPASDKVKPYRHEPDEVGGLGSDQTTAVLADRRGQVWVSTDSSGLHWLDAQRDSFVPYLRDPHVPGSLRDNGVLSMFEDRQGLLWFGSYLGVDRYDPSREVFRSVRQHPTDPRRVAGLGVWALHQDADDELWVGTYTEGMERFDRQGQRSGIYRPNPGDPSALRNGVVSGIVEDGKGGLWVGTWGGLHHFDRKSETFSAYVKQPDDEASLASDRVYHLLMDSRGGLWISMLGGGGVDYLPPDHRRPDLTFEHRVHRDGDERSLAANSVFQALEDHRGDLWFATANGLSRLEGGEGDFQNYLFDPKDPNSLSGNDTQALYEDAKGELWVGTDGYGLSRLGAQRKSFRRYHRDDGLPSESVLAIQGDEDDFIWLSTSKGLARLNPETDTFRLFDAGDGLLGGVYSVGSSLRSSAGELFFGGTVGYDRFWPSEVHIDPQAPMAVITDFLLFNRSAPLTGEDPTSPLGLDIGSLQQVTLDHRHYVFGFEFSSLHFASPSRNRFKYQLEGFDPGWVDTGPDKRFAQYSNLPAGSYTFKVKAANEDGVWSPEIRRLAVVVLPSPWRAWWAYALYGLGLLAAVALYIRAQQRKLAYEQSVSARLRDVNQMKDEFLANTSHELRTPLYGIIGITESLLEGITGKLPIGTRQNLSLISASAKRLSSLVNDILDFSKLSIRHLQLQRGAVDLRSLCDVVLTLSAPLVGSKQLELRNEVDPDLQAVDADEARLQQILLNLVGNAIKFTESGKVEVSVFVEGERAEVKVIDTGIGVPEDQRESIFQAFEQGDTSTERQFGGTGLGLAVTKKLVVLHGGTIGVRPGPEGGSEFFFTLPFNDGESAPVHPIREVEEHLSLPLIPGTLAPVEMVQEVPIDLPPGELKILIVDDEPINRQVLLNHLALDQFVVEQASSGAEALRIVEEGWTPDLVLLDVMMPKMSGYEVCRSLRERFPLAELPVIFLTAKNQPHDLLTGLAQGANDYLTKPITKPELLARVRLHLELLWVHRHLEDMVQERTAQVKTLGGLLPVCGMCKSVRDDTGYWSQLEDFLRSHSETMVTHGICPDCLDEHYGELFGEGRPTEEQVSEDHRADGRPTEEES